jgi:two-component system, OmpR family, KDP operon response regulator KdpE
LDLGLPDMPGQELLQRIRALDQYVSIVVLSGRSDETGKVQALDSGADDYLIKPFGMGELLARMRAALRHQMQTNNESPIFRTGPLSADFVRRIIKVGEEEIKLTPKEYELLRLLAQHAGKVLTHKYLIGELWNGVTDAQHLRVYVRQLRQKIEIDPERPQYLVTETVLAIGCERRPEFNARSSRTERKLRLVFPHNAKEGCADLEHLKLSAFHLAFAGSCA